MTLQVNGAFSGFAVRDIEAAKEFYTQALGLTVFDDRGGLRFDLPGSAESAPASVFVYPKADHEPAGFTILNFVVTDIDTAIDQLESAGVSLLRYEGFGQDERGIARDPEGPAIAWFTDPSGNIFAVLQPE